MITAVPAKTHIYDPNLGEVFYQDGRVERVPKSVLARYTAEDPVEALTVWARLTKRIGPADQIAMLPAT